MEPVTWWFIKDPQWNANYPAVAPNPGYDALYWYVPWSSTENKQEENKNTAVYFDVWVNFMHDELYQNSAIVTSILGEYWKNHFNP